MKGGKKFENHLTKGHGEQNRIMATNRQDIPVLALGLSLYFSVGLISEELSLMCVGLFYGVLGSRGRRYLIGVVSFRSILSVMRSFYRMQVFYATVGEILWAVRAGSSIPFNISLPNINLSIPGSVSNMVVPEWVYMVAGIILLAITIAVMILTLPILITNIVMWISTYIVLFIGTPIFYPGTTVWELIKMIQDAEDQAVIMELIRPFVPWMFVVTYIFYIVGIPSLTFLYLKWIGFYRRIPNAWVNRVG